MISRQLGPVTKKTIGNTLRREGLKSCSARNVPLLKKAHVWSLKIQLFGINSTRRVWRRRNAAYDPNNTISTLKHGGGNIMLWGGGGVLLRGQDNCTASKGQWTGPCTARALKMGCGWVFQHDNDPKHTKKKKRLTSVIINKGFATKYKVIFCEGVKYLFDSLKYKSMYNFFEKRFYGFFLFCLTVKINLPLKL